MRCRQRQRADSGWAERRSSAAVRRSSTITRRAFTLIELLVVIAVIALLMAILLPALQRVRKQVKAVACRSNLREWSLVLAMYTNEHDGRFFLAGRFTMSGGTAWPYQLRQYRPDSNDLLLCPAARTHEVRTDVALAFPTVRDSLGSTSTAWKIRTDRPELTFSGSYGFNSGLIGFYEDEFRGNRHHSSNAQRPYLLDCIFTDADPVDVFDKPPPYEDAVGPFADMSYFCIDRHSAGINAVFLDSSVRKVGLKELWTLRWNIISRGDSRWTKVGGVEPEDWPAWMRKFKDY
jgi:prepilin-type N-terminal cleavage/methylation domain-containing protein